MERQKVTVTGRVDRREVLRAARQTCRAEEFWSWPYDGEYYPFAIQYLVDDTPCSAGPISRLELAETTVAIALSLLELSQSAAAEAG